MIGVERVVLEVGESGFVLVNEGFFYLGRVLVFGVVGELADVFTAQLWVVDFCDFEFADFVS